MGRRRLRDHLVESQEVNRDRDAVGPRAVARPDETVAVWLDRELARQELAVNCGSSSSLYFLRRLKFEHRGPRIPSARHWRAGRRLQLRKVDRARVHRALEFYLLSFSCDILILDCHIIQHPFIDAYPCFYVRKKETLSKPMERCEKITVPLWLHCHPSGRDPYAAQSLQFVWSTHLMSIIISVKAYNVNMLSIHFDKNKSRAQRARLELSIWCSLRDSNPRPPPCDGDALAN